MTSSPSQCREVWVSESARTIWRTKIDSFAAAWLDVKWLSVLDGYRNCAEMTVTHSQLVALTQRLKGTKVEVGVVSGEMSGGDNEAELRYTVLVGKGSEIRHAKKALADNNHPLLGRLFGYPECCCEAYPKFIEAPIDVMWCIAARTSQVPEGARAMEVAVEPDLNVFWRQSGVQLIPHFPCSFRCENSRRLAGDLRQCAHTHGREREWLSSRSRTII